MGRELRPADVAVRLARLRALYVPMRENEARARMEQAPRDRRRTFTEDVARRLAELRALCELTAHLRALPPRD